MLTFSDATELVGRTLKTLESRKNFLHQQYVEILRTQPHMLVCQHNNLTPQESRTLRAAIKAQTDDAARLTVVRAGIFSHALRVTTAFDRNPAYWDRINPHSLRASWLGRRKGVNDMAPLLMGPTAIVTLSRPLAEFDPAILRAVLAIIQQSQNRLVLLGGRLEGKLFDVSNLNEIKALPGIADLHAQLVGLLQAPASQLAGTLSTAGGAHLARVLDSRKETTA